MEVGALKRRENTGVKGWGWKGKGKVGIQELTNVEGILKQIILF